MSWDDWSPGSLPKIRNPYRGGVLALSVLCSVLGIPAIIGVALAWQRGDWREPWMIPVAVIAGLATLFGDILLTIWILGYAKAQRIVGFLVSERPLVRWTYSPDEWRQIREARWQEEKGDWKVQWGCLTALLGIAGLLAGVFIGAEEGLSEALIDGFIGLLIGGLFGAFVGAAVAAGNHLASRQAHQQATPDPVALAPNEIYANGDYFRGDGQQRYIQEAHIERGDWDELVLTIIAPKFRGSPEEEWRVPIPARQYEAVEAILPALAGPPPDDL